MAQPGSVSKLNSNTGVPITMALSTAIVVAGSVTSASFPDSSLSDASLSATAVASRSREATPAPITYTPVACADRPNGAMATTSPVSRVTSSVPLVRTTGSEKFTVTSIDSPAVYAPSGVFETIETIVGASMS